MIRMASKLLLKCGPGISVNPRHQKDEYIHNTTEQLRCGREPIY